MKHFTKRLTVLMLLLCAFAYAQADKFEDKGLWFSTNNDGKTCAVSSNGNGVYSGNIVIPEAAIYNGKSYKVTSISNRAFYGCSELTSVTIPNSVTSIDYSAFSGCSELTSVTIPNSVTRIGNEAFSGCSKLTSAPIPNSVTQIGYYAFNGCSGLTSVTIPNSVTYIGAFAFKGCSGLTSVTIPNSVTRIGSYAFDGCTGLTTVIFNAEKCTQWGTNTNPVFKTCTKLSTLTIGKSVTTIPSYVFSGCTGLTSIVVDEGNTKYDSRNNCNAIIETASNTLIFGCKGSIIPNSVTSIGNDAFNGCIGLTSVTIPNSVTSIGNDAFNGCIGLTSVTIPNSVTSIGDYAFKGCTALTEVDLNSVLNLGDKAFSGCTGLKSVSMLKAKSANAATFEGCTALEELVLPYEWGKDFKMDLSGTTQLRTLYIGENIASIPGETFANNKNLFEVYSNATTPPSFANATFGSETYTYATLYVPQGSVDAYKAAYAWSRFDDIQGMPYQVVVKDKKVSVECNKTLTVSATVTPATATTAPIKWYSLDSTIATVTIDGEVTGVAEGGVTLVAYCNGITSTTKVIVKKFIGVEDIAADSSMENALFEVYNLQGVRVRTDCTKEQLSELSHGIYILVSPQGRKKVII